MPASPRTKPCFGSSITTARPTGGNPRLPVSGEPALFQGSDEWLKALAAKSLFAVRLGTLKFRGFEPKTDPHRFSRAVGRGLQAAF